MLSATQAPERVEMGDPMQEYLDKEVQLIIQTYSSPDISFTEREQQLLGNLIGSAGVLLGNAELKGVLDHPEHFQKLEFNAFLGKINRTALAAAFDMRGMGRVARYGFFPERLDPLYGPETSPEAENLQVTIEPEPAVPGQLNPHSPARKYFDYRSPEAQAALRRNARRFSTRMRSLESGTKRMGNASFLDLREEKGACKGVDPELFHPGRGEDTAPAKEVCKSCVLTDACLDYALENVEKIGIWGGTSEKERRVIRRQRKAEVA